MAINTYIPLDVLRQDKTLVNLTPNFNGRVGDSESYIKLWFKSNGLPLDLSKTPVSFWGSDPNGTKFQIQGTASVDQPGDGLQTGRITFRFPAETFQVPGDWDDETTFFAIQDEDGNRISTVNVHMHVLDDKVSMGINSKPFISDLEKVKQEMLDWIEDGKEKINEAADEVLNADSTLNKTLAALKTQLTAYQSAIDTGAVPSKKDFEDFKTSVTDTLNGFNKWIVKTTAVDFNSLTTDGRYWIQVTGNKNGPVDSWGYLIVSAPIATRIMQEFTTDDGAKYIRVKNESAWGSWQHVTVF